MDRLDRTNGVSVCNPLMHPCMNSWRYSPSCRGHGLGVELQVLYRYCIGNRGNKFCQLVRGHHSGTHSLSDHREPRTASACSLCCSGELLEPAGSGAVSGTWKTQISSDVFSWHLILAPAFPRECSTLSRKEVS